MLTVFVVAWVVAIRSCARVRCGAAVPSRLWERVWQGFESLKDLTITADTRKPDSVSSAFARLYWRDSCRTATLVFVLLGCIVFVFSLFPGIDSSGSVFVGISLFVWFQFLSGF